MMRRNWRRMLGIVLVLVLILTVWGVVIYLDRVNDAYVRGKTTANLYAIDKGIWSYVEKYQTLPPAYVIDRHGNKHSWRILILEFLKPDLYAEYSFDEPWDGPNNSRLLPRMPNFYKNYATKDDSSTHTRFVAITGQGCAFDGPKTVKVEDMLDDPATTIMIVECTSIKVPWMAPIDLPIDEMSFRINDSGAASISTDRNGGPYGWFRCHDARLLPLTLTERDIRAMTSIQGGERIDQETLKRVD